MTDYELTRRDALIALGGAGAVAGGGALTWAALNEDDDTDPPLAERERRTVIAVAEAVYPSEVDGISSFVETYVVGRVRERPAHLVGIRDAARALDENARAFTDRHFTALDPGERDELLRGYGLPEATPDPNGSEVQRVRYYLLNELLYALYTSPTGGRLVGIENPQGHPGGIESYRRPSSDETPD